MSLITQQNSNNLKNMRYKSLALFLVSISCLHTSSQAAVTFNFDFIDVNNSSGLGFDDATQGADRRNTIANVGAYLGSTVFANHTATVDIRVNASQTDGTGFLATASTYFNPDNSMFQKGDLANHIITGVDPDAANPDGFFTMDFGHSFYSGSGTAPVGQYDLNSVALHEISHSLGLLSFVSSDGTGAGGNNTFSGLDEHMQTTAGAQIFSTGGTAVSPSLLVGNNVYFAGANAVAANGGNRVQMYAPFGFQPGSSISHLNDEVGVMWHILRRSGNRPREYGNVELAMLADIGYDVTYTVPEPSTTVYLSALFGVFAFHRNRRRH